MLSKKIEFNFLSLFKKSKSSPFNEINAEGKRLSAIEEVDFQAKASGFAIGFFIFIAFGALILAIGLVGI